MGNANSCHRGAYGRGVGRARMEEGRTPGKGGRACLGREARTPGGGAHLTPREHKSAPRGINEPLRDIYEP
jgi:hypothetical protein